MYDIVTGFFDQCNIHPYDTAVEHLDIAYSFHELSVLSKRIAKALHTAVGSRSKVLLAMTASPNSYASMIGTLLNGGTFCPIDMNGPEERNFEIFNSFNPDVILYDSVCSIPLCGNTGKMPIIDIQALPDDNSELVATDSENNDIAYVVFTSGSTGQPKGVRIGRKAFSHFVLISQMYFRVRPGERWSQYSNLGYDIAMMDTFMALCSGATIVTFTRPSDRLLPARAILNYGINIWQSVPSIIDLMLTADRLDGYLKSVRIMSFCGEPLLPSHLDALFSANPNLVVFNTYGTTETTGFNTINILTSKNYRASCKSATVALGQEVSGWKIALIGGPSSSEGQIVVCGENLSLGYWKDEEKTEVSFREISLESELIRAYFTGDWGELIDGNLYFRGRIDRQVKIKGERIELDEIDFRLRQSGFTAAGSVMIDEAIYSYVETQILIDQDAIRSRLSKLLPFHAVPKRIIALERLPRNRNGKIEYTELRKLSTTMKQNE